MSTEHQIAEEARRVAIVQAALGLQQQGKSQSEIAGILDVSAPTLSRYLHLHRIGGFAALRPATTNAGRKPLMSLTEAEQQAVQRLTLQVDPHDPTKSRRVSVSFALRAYARTEGCRPELAEAILKPRSSKHTLTPTLRRQARVTKSTRLLNAGPEAFNLHGIVTPRDLTWLDDAGVERPIFPGLLFESDDMTANEPCWVPWDDAADPCAAKFGCRLMRPQMLPWLDVGSASFRSYSLVLRYNDAYRARDILWSISHLFHTVGAPQYLRLEYGTWDANLINAVESVHRICQIKRATSAKTKFIENRFHTLQKFLALGGVSMGRHRGVKELETKQWLACREGRLDPRTVFPSLDQWIARVDAAFTACNAEPIEGEVYGPANAQRFHGRRAWVPDEIWALHIAGQPMRRPTLEESYRLLPEQREVSVRGGHVGVKCAEHDATFWFYHDSFARLGDGYKVTVCFDPAQPELGAAVLNREQGARAAVDPDTAQPGRPYRADQLVCIAEAVDRVPQFSATTQWNDEASFERRRRYREQCRLQYRAIMPFGRGQAAAAKITEHRDGRGNVAVAEVNASRLAPLTATPAADRPISPAIAERARRQDTRQLVQAAAAGLNDMDLAAAGQEEPAEAYNFKPGELGELLGGS